MKQSVEAENVNEDEDISLNNMQKKLKQKVM